MQLDWINEDTLQVQLGGPLDHEIAAQLASIQRHLLQSTQVRNCVAGFGRLQIQLTRPTTPLLDIQGLIDQALAQGIDHDQHLSEFVIPTCYDPELGPDLISLAEAIGLEPSELIDRHAQRSYRVLATGFCPGFGYMGETHPSLHVPRRTTPRLNVPAGSVAIAENQTVVYPQTSPGGWHLIGQTRIDLINTSTRGMQAQLQLGRRVRFEPIDRAHFER